MMEELEGKLSISKFQNGGRKNRSANDNWLAMLAILDSNRERRKKNYLVFADAAKCFDRLWLEDCLLDMVKDGMRERKANLLYEMKKNSQITIITPYEETERFNLERVVKKETIYGPQLCCSSTSKINDIGETRPETLVYGNLWIATLAYIDDIASGGSEETEEGVGNNLKAMEREKGFRFNTDKTKYLTAKIGKEKCKNLAIEVEMGSVERLDKYKFLGNWIGEDGAAALQIEEKEKEVTKYIVEIYKMGKEEWLGTFSTEARLLMYGKTMVPGVIYNLEYWTDIEERLIERLEKIQGKTLKGLLMLPDSMPYLGILKETGTWPMEKKIWYHSLMLYQHMMDSDVERLGKVIITTQKEKGYGKNWYSQRENIASDPRN